MTRRRGDVPSSQRVARCVERVGEREPVRDDRELPKTCAIEQAHEVGTVISAVVANPLVLWPEPAPTLGNAHECPSAGSKMAKPGCQRELVVLDVLEDLELTDAVEGLRRREILDRAVEHLSVRPDAAPRRLERDRVRLDADVVEPFCEKGADRSETCADLEDAVASGRNQAPDHVVTQPGR